MMAYLIQLTRDSNGTFLVTSPAFPEVTTFGASERDALDNARAAIEEAIAARISDGDPLPSPSAGTSRKQRKRLLLAKLPLLISLKAQLYMTMREAGVTRAELARRLGWHREQVDRLFRLDHASRVDQIEAAFEKLHRGIDVQVRKVA
jgi:antitoxin HicB